MSKRDTNLSGRVNQSIRTGLRTLVGLHYRLPEEFRKDTYTERTRDHTEKFRGHIYRL